MKLEKYKENLRPYGRLLNRYLTTLEAVEEFKKGVTHFTLRKVQEKLFAGFLSLISEQEIILRLSEMKRNFMHDRKTFNRYLQEFYGVTKLPEKKTIPERYKNFIIEIDKQIQEINTIAKDKKDFEALVIEYLTERCITLKQIEVSKEYCREKYGIEFNKH